MALPGALGASLAKDMASKGMAPAATAPTGDDGAPPDADADDSGGVQAILDDIDKAAGPGVGSLIQELIERMMPEA